MTAQEMWDKFISENNISNKTYDAWSFGSDANLLANLVVTGQKTATASAYVLYELENEKLPEVNQYSIILNTNQEAVCIIKTTKVYVTTFNEVTKEHAYKEGEGDRSLKYWQEVHKQFFSECLNEAGLTFSQDMKVVCEEFEVVYK